MKNFPRLLIFVVVGWCFVAQLYFIAIPFYLWYLLRYQGYELIFLAILIDGYFQSFYSVPIFSLVTILGVFFIDIIKPQLLMYTSKNEVVS